MTQNQLKYWELRWKQHYEKIIAEETERSNRAKELETERANKAREAETRRHNLAEEKIAQQQLVISRSDLSRKWGELNETIQAHIVQEGLEWAHIQQKGAEITISAVNAATNAMNAYTRYNELAEECYHHMSEERVQWADVMLAAYQANNKADEERIKTYLSLLTDMATVEGEAHAGDSTKKSSTKNSNKGTTSSEEDTFKAPGAKGSIGLDIGKILAGLDKGIQEFINQRGIYDDVITMLHDMYPEARELYGPEAQKWMGTQMKNVNAAIGAAIPEYKPLRRNSQESRIITEQTYPGSTSDLHYGGGLNSLTNSVAVNNSTSSNTNNIQPGVIETKRSSTSGGTNYTAKGGLVSSGVIYSGNSNYGPGYR